MELVEKLTWENQAKRKAQEYVKAEARRAKKAARMEAQRAQVERWSWAVVGGSGALTLAYLALGDLGRGLGCLAVLFLAAGSAVRSRG